MSIGNTSMIGSRFWQFADLNDLGKVRLDGAGEKDRVKDRKIHDSGLTSFLKNGKLDLSNEAVRSAVNRAEIFAATHVLTDGERVAEEKLARAKAAKIGIDFDFFCEEAAGIMTEQTKAGLADEAEFTKMLPFAKTALQKLLLTREVDAFQKLLELNGGAAGDELSKQGKAALMNAVLGLSGMLERGEISENAVIQLADGDFYDISNTADVLKLAATTASKVKETFIREKELQAAIRFYEEKIAEAEKQGKAELVKTANAALATLKTAAANLVNIRELAAGGIVTEYKYTDETGKDASDKKFQREQIRAIRESLRAFRYDLDLRTGKPMGRMESFRRWCDEHRPRFRLRTRQTEKSVFGFHPYLPTLGKDARVSDGYRIDGRLFQDLENADKTYNAALKGLCDLFPGTADECSSADVRVCADEATVLSHTANDAIRYYFSGKEQNESQFAKDVHKEFDDIVKRGGSRQVSLEVGAEFMVSAGLGELVKAKAGGGGAYKFKVQLAVPDGGGPIAVTYTHTGKAYGGISGKAGGEKSHVRADVSAEGHASMSWTFMRTYSNLDDFIVDVNGGSMVMKGSLMSVIAGGVKAAAKWVGSGVLLGATKLGFRIHKSQMDKVAYAATLRKGDVFSNLDGLLLRRKNSTVIESRDAKEIGFGASAGANANTYGILGTDMNSEKTNLAFGGKVGFDISWEFGVNGKTYRSFAASLAKCSLKRIEGVFNAEAAALVPENGKSEFVDNVEALLNDALDRDGVANGIEKLMLSFEDLERTATGKNEADKDFWTDFAKKVRLCSIAAEILIRRGEEIGKEANDRVLLNSVKAVKTWLSGRMANPAVRIPPAIFEDVLQKVSPVANPPVVRVQGDLEISAQFGDDYISQKVNSAENLKFGVKDIKIVPGGLHASVAKTGGVFVGKAMGKTAYENSMNVARNQAGLAPKVHAKVTYTHPRGNRQDVRPWVNASTLSVDVDVSTSMPVRLLVEVIARAAVKSMGGKDEMEDSRLFQEMKEEIISNIAYGVVLPTALKGGAGVLALSVGELALHSPKFRDFLIHAGLKGVDLFLKAKEANLSGDFKTQSEYSKTIRFSFLNRRMSSFSVADNVAKTASVKLGVGSVGFNFNYAMSKSVTDYMSMNKPSVAALLGAVNTQLAAGNPEQLKHFLVRNKNGVLRLLRTASLNPADVQADGDGKFATDRDEMKKTVGQVDSLLSRLGKQDSAIGEEAQALWKRFDAVRDMAWYPAQNQTDAQRLETAREFFTVLASAYSLQARADAESESDAAP